MLLIYISLVGANSEGFGILINCDEDSCNGWTKIGRVKI